MVIHCLMMSNADGPLPFLNGTCWVWCEETGQVSTCPVSSPVSLFRVHWNFSSFLSSIRLDFYKMAQFPSAILRPMLRSTLCPTLGWSLICFLQVFRQCYIDIGVNPGGCDPQILVWSRRGLQGRSWTFFLKIESFLWKSATVDAWYLELRRGGRYRDKRMSQDRICWRDIHRCWIIRKKRMEL